MQIVNTEIEQSFGIQGELMHDSTSNAARHKAKFRQSPALVTQQKLSLSSLT